MGIYKCVMCKKSYGPLLADPFGMQKGIKTRDGSYACSNTCARDWNHHVLNSGGNLNSNQSGNSNNSGSSNSGQKISNTVGNFIVDSMKSEEQRLLDSGMSSQDIAAMKLAEQQEKTKRLEMENNLEMEKMKAKQEKVRLKHEKIEKLRAEKKYVSVFILEHPYIFGIACFFALMMLVNIYRNVSGITAKEENEKKAFVEMNNNLEKIEGEIIDGINKKKNSKELLDLVAKLNHPNTEDYIQGKKYGIIKSNIYSIDDDFHGSYSEYWTARREAYKDIIAQGLTINEYLNKIKKEEMKK